MILVGGGAILTGSPLSTWEFATVDQITNEVLSTVPNAINVIVTITLTNQTLQTQRTLRSDSVEDRQLTVVKLLLLTFDVFISFKLSPSAPLVTAASLITGAFDTSEKVLLYEEELATSNSASLTGVTAVDIIIGPTTPSPSAQPTSRVEQVVPTKTPTLLPTRIPTSQPTPLPTGLPTTPTIQPASPPTTSPTSHPTILPTRPPTPAPTLLPTIPPTPLPTASPTLFPVRSFKENGIVAVLVGGSLLDAPSLNAWLLATINLITNATTAEIPNVRSVNVSAVVTNQTIAGQRPPVLFITFDVSLTFKILASAPLYTAEGILGDAFNSTDLVKLYKAALAAVNSTALTGLQSVDIDLPADTPQPTPPPTLPPQPTSTPSHSPTLPPTPQPTTKPTPVPTPVPTSKPTAKPTHPTASPSRSAHPSGHPSHNPSITSHPSRVPSRHPSHHPSHTNHPSRSPSSHPSHNPSITNRPSIYPSKSNHPSRSPSIHPSESPGPSPSPSHHPSTHPHV
jgi:outer membrane biosynthesis protein TonB